MEMNLNEELMQAQKECEQAFAVWNQAQGKLNYLLSLIRQQTQESEVANDLKN